MYAIAYVSSASWNLIDAEIEHIVEASRRNNAACGVTGALLYCDGNFMQYIEGSEEAVVDTFARIRASDRHYQINELMNQQIEEREFGDWTMSFARATPAEFLQVASARWKGSAQTGPGADLLRTFWANCRIQLA
jgi:hypothetical protein